MSKQVYLAGPITGLTFDGCTDWRKAAKAKLAPEISAYSPMRCKDFLASEGVLEGAYAQSVLSTCKGITTRDRFDVQNCDAVLMNLAGAERVSVGTVIEIGWADAYRKPIVLVMERAGNLHAHPMISEIAAYHVETLEEGIAVVRAILLPH